MLKTRFTEMMGIEHPIMCGGMAAVGTADLIAPVANAGGLGCLTALTQPTPEALSREIARCREMTERPFAVNLTILPTITPVPYDEYLAAIIESGVTIVETAGNNPEPFLPMLKAAGVKVIHKAVSIRHAVKAQSVGVDVVSIDGFECAGHPGEDDVPGLILIPAAVRALKIPVIASGGFANGMGLVAALALGAEGINMGTRFVATQEAPVHHNVKLQIVENDERSTLIVFRKFHNSARVAKNSISMEIREIEGRQDSQFADVASLASGSRGRAVVLNEGDMEGGLWWAGQAQGLIHDIPSVSELIQRISDEAICTIQERLPNLVMPLDPKSDQQPHGDRESVNDGP
jgi:NAD(P)H-dependent flavin oxidoreductase YrpB (nitropropane dioxygenase family)